MTVAGKHNLAIFVGVQSCCLLPSHRNNFVEDCVRLRNGRSLQHPKQISARAIVEGIRRTILVLCSNLVQYSQMRYEKDFPQMFSCLRRSDRRERDSMGHLCMHAYAGPMRGDQQVHCSGARQLRRGPRLKQPLSVCCWQTQNNVTILIPIIKLVWVKGFGKLVWCILMWVAESAFSWYDALIIYSSNYFCWVWMFAYFVEFKTFRITVPVCPLNWSFFCVFHFQTNLE